MAYAAPSASLARTLGNGTLLKTLLAAFVVSQLTIAFILGPISNDLILLQLGALFKPELYEEVTSRWTTMDKLRFQKHFTVDFWFHPTLYGIIGLVAVTHETFRLGYSPIPYALFACVPLVAGFCDIMENSLHYDMFMDHSKATLHAVRLASLFATLKWMLIIPTGLWCASKGFSRIMAQRASRRAKTE